jgi:hypothetical protein
MMKERESSAEKRLAALAERLRRVSPLREEECPHCDGEGLVYLFSPPSSVTGICGECGGTGITETETEEEEMTPRGEKLNAAIGRFADDISGIYGDDLANLSVLLHVLETVHGGICHAVSERLDEERDRHTDAQAASMGAEPEPEREKPENWPWGRGSFWAELRKAGIPVKGRA